MEGGQQEGEPGQTGVQADSDGKDGEGIADSPIADFQIKLLEKAFETASLEAIDIFKKDRSKNQQLVVETCLGLEQPVRAIRYSDKIENWRRGLCYAKGAYYLAQQGYSYETLRKGIELAETIAAIDHGQKWRSDRIKAKISQTYSVLGMSEKAADFREGLEESEKGGVMKTRTANPDVSFEKQVKALEDTIAIGNFELTIGSLHAYGRLFDVYYDDLEKRDLIEENIENGFEKSKVPITIRMDVKVELIESALGHEDKEKARELLAEAEKYITDFQWTPDNKMKLRAELGKLYFRAGMEDKAREDIEGALEVFKENREHIQNFMRSEALYPLAEAYKTFGQVERSREIYKTAIEESVVNPNPRPCADDLTAVYCSMALYGVEPDAELWALIARVNEELGSR